MKLPRYLKIINVKGNLVQTRAATNWEIIKYFYHMTSHLEPDPKNILMDTKDMEMQVVDTKFVEQELSPKSD